MLVEMLQESPTLAVVLAIVVLALVIKLLRRDRAPKGYRLPPVYSSPIPVVGNFIDFARDPLGIIRTGYAKCGHVFTIDMVAEKCTFLIGAEAHKAFFEASDEELDQAPVYSFMKPIFGAGIVYDSPLKKRRQQMRALGRSLRPSVLKTYPPIIARETKAYLDAKFGQEGTIEDLHKVFAELIINTASATLLGPEIRGEMFAEMSHLYEMLDKGLTPLSVFFPNAPTASHRMRDRARLEISKLFSRVIEKRRNDKEHSGDYNDMVQMLMEFRYKDGSPFTDDEIAGMIVATLFAGQHTSSIVSTWSTLYLLEDKRNNNGKYHDRVMEEMQSLQPQDGAFARAEGLDSTVVQKEVELYKTIKESIRLQPPLILLMRRAVKPITVSDGTYIPAGHRVIVSNAIAQRLPEVFERPNDFDPSRWDSFDISKTQRYSFIGFGSGTHTCLGESFAFMQVRTILSVLFSTFDLELITPFPEADYEAMVVPPKGPNRVRFKRRTLAAKVPTSLGGGGTGDQNPVPEATAAATSKAAAEELNTTEFTREQVAKHNTKDSLWIIVHDKVYDVTNYLDLHQGGDNAILKYGGKDATKAVEGPQHPSTVPALLARYEIGRLKN